MNRIRWLEWLLIVLMMVVLTGCGDRLPNEVRWVILSAFDPDEQPRISSAVQAELLTEDLAAGAEEVWCVNITFRCFTPYYYDRNELSTCGDSRLVRRIGETWQVTRLVSDQDRASWEARGCEVMPAIIGLP